MAGDPLLEIERLKGAIEKINALNVVSEKKISDQNEELADLREQLLQTQKEVSVARSEFKTFIAQLNAGWTVLAVLGGVTLGISYFIYNIFSLRLK